MDTTLFKDDVLDHGFVRLIDHMGDDLSIVRNARVSYDAAWRSGENEGSDHRLLGYLMRNGHNTPFEAVTVTFEVKAPIFVFRQWHRHRTQSYNELSARYKPLPEEYYVPDPLTIGVQSTDNKQMREMDGSSNDNASRIIADSNFESYKNYQLLLKMGTPREVARSVLPLGMYSHMFATANLHNWLRFLSERIHEHAQYEIQVYATAIKDLLCEIVPVTMDHWKENQ